jgi:hypothetical protein
VAGGVGLGGFVVAGPTTGVLVARHAEIDDECPHESCSPAGRALIDGNAPIDAINVTGFAVGAAGVVTGVILLAVGAKSAPPRAAIVPAPTAGGVGLFAIGRFE